MQQSCAEMITKLSLLAIINRATSVLEALPESVTLQADAEAFQGLMLMILHGMIERQLLPWQLPAGDGKHIWKVIDDGEIASLRQLSQTCFTDQVVAEVHSIR
jgi:hypothetical protein